MRFKTSLMFKLHTPYSIADSCLELQNPHLHDMAQEIDPEESTECPTINLGL